MSRWFPQVDDHEGADAALKGGYVAALFFAGSIGLGIAWLVFSGATPGSRTPVNSLAGALIGIAVELAVVLIAAWRFKTGKGLVWGTVALVLFVLEIVTKFENGSAGVFWWFFYAAVAAGLVNGVRGAWAKRNLPPHEDYSEVFE